MARTIGGLILEARTMLHDRVPLPAYRYTDADMMDAFNGAMLETRNKRPDLFLAMGLRTPVPTYVLTDTTTVFPIDEFYYPAFLYYLVGRAELREDTFSEDSRAVSMMNKFVSQLLSVQA